jgi:hypothetical protein
LNKKANGNIGLLLFKRANISPFSEGKRDLPPPDIPESVRQFIFSYIDSVEQLEVLLMLRARTGESFTARAISEQLRSTEASVSLRMAALARSGLIEGDEASGYKFFARRQDLAALLNQLEEAHRTMRYRVLELIFSPLKKARNFADAFVVSNPKKSEDENG